MTSTATRLSAAALLAVMLSAAMSYARSAPPPAPEPAAATPQTAPPASQAPASPPAALNLASLDPAKLARDLDRDHELDRDHGLNRTGGGNPLRSARQKQLEHGIDDAYVEAHRALAEDVTNAQDGTDRVYRIKTPYGVNACLNWRDVDRFNPGKGKALFVGACNR